jgi:hypothetical protein
MPSSRPAVVVLAVQGQAIVPLVIVLAVQGQAIVPLVIVLAVQGPLLVMNCLPCHKPTLPSPIVKSGSTACKSFFFPI